MTVVVSKVKGGSLTLTASSGSTAGTASDWSCQYTSVSIKPGTDSTASSADTSYVLCGDPIPASATSGGGFGDTLDFTVISDHNVAAGLIAFSWAHRGEVVSFSFTPNKTPDEGNGAAAQTWAGTCIVEPLEVGGEVQGDLRISGSWKITGLTPPTGFGAGYSPAKEFASPGITFAAESTVTASDAANANKLTNLGYKPVPSTAWLTNQAITIGTFKFHWDGSKWAPGAGA